MQQCSRNHRLDLLIPLSIVLVAIDFEYTGFDLWIAGQFFDAESAQWPYRSLFVTNTLLHDWAQNLMKLAGVLIAGLLVSSCFVPRIRPYRRDLGYLFLAAASGPLIVSTLKNITHIQVPWNLSLFGGDMPYIRLFDTLPGGIPVGHAFPGGHSSGGFAFFGLYFLLYFRAHQYRSIGLMVPITLGGIFSISQEIRGAHFPSHDLFSLAICWIAALAWSWAFYGNRGQTIRNTAQPG